MTKNRIILTGYKNDKARYSQRVDNKYIKKIAGCTLTNLHTDVHAQTIVDKHISEIVECIGKSKYFDYIVVSNDFTGSNKCYDFRGGE
jgi:hypothetical protein